MIRFDHVSYRYPHAEYPTVENIHFHVPAGSITVVSGPSGCGKTTILRLANGLAPHYWKGELTGTVSIQGIDNQTRTVARIAEDAGTLFQDPEEQFFALNIGDEIAFALTWMGLPASEIRARVHKAARRLWLRDQLEQEISALSEGEKQRVGMASLLAQGAKVLILDEPSANLDPETTRIFAQLLQELKSLGYAILIVDHRLAWLRPIADQIVLIEQGHMVYCGDLSILDRADSANRFGLRKTHFADVRSQLPEPPLEKAIWRIDHLTAVHGGTKKKKEEEIAKTRLVHNLSFSLPVGITALIGRNGSGKTTVARAIAGLERCSGRIYTAKNKRSLAPNDRLQRAGLVLQNADHQLQMPSVLEEVRAVFKAHTPSDRKALWGSRFTQATLQRFRREAMALLEDLDLARLADRHPQSLSGGEKQRLVVACALAKNPRVLILDEPTSGLDGRNMLRMAHILRKQADLGRAILLVTNDMELLAEVAQYVVRIHSLRHRA